ncbi:MAG: hypothetical protein ACYCX2_06660 [Christensenellales bacterium]
MATAQALQETIEYSRMGWKKEEEETLWKEVGEARRNGRPLKSVFSRVAEFTGRKPNSIRNYYYLRMRQEDPAREQERPKAFVPFEEDEVFDMMVTILGEQAKGVSVRACTLRMGNGENKAMLRYQNKYRSVIRNNSEMVQKVLEHMRENNIPAYDPYAQGTRRGRRPLHQNNLTDMVSSIVTNMQLAMDRESVMAFFGALEPLCENGAAGERLRRRIEKYEELNGKLQRELKREHSEASRLREKLSSLQSEMEELRHAMTGAAQKPMDIGMQTALFKRLIRVNQEFLSWNSMVKVSSLSEYIERLNGEMKACEKLLQEG